MSAFRRFARIVPDSSGREVLFYIEPCNGDYEFHQVIPLDEVEGSPQIDIKIGFTTEDKASNEKLAYAALDKIDADYVDRLIVTAMQILEGMYQNG